MGVRLSDSEHISLYDSVSGTSFGPVFDTEEDANSFLQWYSNMYRHDMRTLSEPALMEVYSRWRRGYIRPDEVE